MYRIVGVRGSGKTYQLLEEVNRVGGVIISKNPRGMREKAHYWGFTNVVCVGYEESKDYLYEKPVFIDELEEYAKALAGRTFSGYTYTLGE